MKLNRYFFIIFCLISFLGFGQKPKSRIKTLIKPNSSIRALEITSSGDIWFAGSNGTYGVSYNKGKSWEVDSILFHDMDLNFRGISSSPLGISLMAVDNPGMIFKTTDDGINWYLTYYEDGEGVFYDAINFYNIKEGIVLGDPIDGCFSILKTYDGGNTWKKISCDNLPQINEGVAAFAASNTNIEIVGDSTWIVTGGKEANVLFSPDKGETWTIIKTPIVSGQTMTGIYSIDFYDENNGVIIGGNWEKKAYNINNKAITKDGGKTWNIVGKKKKPGYQSCIQYIPNSNAKKMVSVGATGVYYSGNFGKTWARLSKKPFYSLKFISSNKAILSGHNNISLLTISN